MTENWKRWVARAMVAVELVTFTFGAVAQNVKTTTVQMNQQTVQVQKTQQNQQQQQVIVVPNTQFQLPQMPQSTTQQLTVQPGSQNVAISQTAMPLPAGPICGGVVNGRLQDPCPPTSAKFLGNVPDLAKCPEGTFMDLGKGGCWTCPPNYDRTAAAIDHPQACGKRIKSDIGPYASAQFLNSGHACPGGFFDPIRGGECWQCPAGYIRGTDSVEGKEACVKFATPVTRKAVYVRNAACKDGAFFDPREGGECWTCPPGTIRSLAAVTADNACYIPAHDELRRAERHQNTIWAWDCKDGKFWDGWDGGACWSCPSGFNRTANHINSDGACSRAIGEVHRKATFRNKFGVAACGSDSFFDPRNGGECWSCPANHNRTAAPVDADDACAERTTSLRILAYEKALRMNMDPCGAKNAFEDPRNGGECWACPDNYERTVFPVTGSNACVKQNVLFEKAIKKSEGGCFAFDPKAFWDPVDGGTCWVCPSGYTRGVSHVKSNTACAREGLGWRATPFTDPGLFGLKGADAVAIALLRERKTIDAAIDEMWTTQQTAAAAGASPAFRSKQEWITTSWKGIARAPHSSPVLKLAVLRHMFDVAEKPATATQADIDLMVAFSKYVHERRVYTANEALLMLKNWMEADRLSRAQQNQKSGSVAALFDYGTVPPDFANIVGEAVVGASTGGALLMGSTSLMMTGASKALFNRVFPYASQAIQRAAQRAAMEVGKRVAEEAVETAIKSAAASAVAGAAVIASVFAILIEVSFEQAMAINEAVPDLERALRNAQADQRDFIALTKTAPGLTDIQTWWAVGVGPDLPLAPQAVVAEAQQASAVALAAYAPPPQFEIVSQTTKACLAVKGPIAKGTAVDLAACDGMNARWVNRNNALMPANGNNLCLGLTSQGLLLQPCGFGINAMMLPSQTWALKEGLIMSMTGPCLEARLNNVGAAVCNPVQSAQKWIAIVK